MADLVITPPSSIDTIMTEGGSFDKIMEGIKRHLESEYKADRIVGSNYKDVYLASLQLAVQSSIGYEEVKIAGQNLLIANEKLKLEKDKAENETLLIKAKKGATIAQIKLYDRQRKGYTDNAQSQALKILSDTFVVLKSKGGDVATNLPDSIAIQGLEKSIKDHLKTVGLNSVELEEIPAPVPDPNDVGVTIGETQVDGSADDYVPSPTIPVNTTVTIE